MGEEKAAKPEPAPQAAAAPAAAPEAAKKKLSYKLQRELEATPEQIDALEAELAGVQEEISAPSFYQRPAEETRVVLERLDSLQAELDRLIERWAELEE